MYSLRKFFNLLSSMRFAICLLLVLAVVSIIGSVIKQNEPYSNYLIQFGPFWFDFFKLLGFYDVYHSLWFLAILLFLVLSVSTCIYKQFSGVLRHIKQTQHKVTEQDLLNRRYSHIFSHELKLDDLQKKLLSLLKKQGYRSHIDKNEQAIEVSIFARKHPYQKLGYFFTHTAIVVICFGGLLDGNLPLQIQEWLGIKKIETRDIPSQEVPSISRLSSQHLSFRANMTIAEGSQGNVAFLRHRNGYFVQEIPFSIALKEFRIQHYATGQPKSFESDLLIFDPSTKQTVNTTIRVNTPFTYKGITIYQSDFQDGGSHLDFSIWHLLSPETSPKSIRAQVFESQKIGKLKLEVTDFRLFNILKLTESSKPKNMGPSVTFKLRNESGQAVEYLNYMNPMIIDGRSYLVSGMRKLQQEEYRYLKIPLDKNESLQGFITLQKILFNPALYPEIAERLAQRNALDVETGTKFKRTVLFLLNAWKQGGYTSLLQQIEKSVPEKEQEKVVETYFKIMQAIAITAYEMGRDKPTVTAKNKIKDEQFDALFLQESLTAINESFFYGQPLYFQLNSFKQIKASGLQLTKSPGKFWVYTGSVMLVIGIFIMFFIQEHRMWLLLKKSNLICAWTASKIMNEKEWDKIKLSLNEIVSS